MAYPNTAWWGYGGVNGMAIYHKTYSPTNPPSIIELAVRDFLAA